LGAEARRAKAAVRYAFTFDASACTGCKACQVACKDKNGLPLGMLWRRVYEVSGGAWERRGAAWTNTVFAYNVSMACNHCAEPACATACPTGAYVIRDDGIVWIDSGRCVGCGYCSWVCPYSAPQYSHDLGRMTKCDFCRDLLDEGLPPACVAACPMRALDFTEVMTGGALEPVAPHALWDAPATTHPYPLPAFSSTQPRVALKPHAAMQNTLPKTVANREEVRPLGGRPVRTAGGLHLDELPLVVFTLLGQAAAGVAVISLFTRSQSASLILTIGVLILLAALASLLHVGRTSQVWRAPTNGGTSALSREILMLILFAAAWLVAWRAPSAGRLGMAVCGVALVYAMAEVYAIEGIAGWSRWRTHVAFASSAVLLGGVGVVAISGLAPLWLAAVMAGGVFADQFVRRWRFYEARHAKVM
jgi:anaerobic dimethyl sulfoxide reductase subunit B